MAGAALLPLLLLLASRGSRACSEVPAYRGSLTEEALAVVGWTLQQTSSGTCACCGLCHQHSDCSSLSYHADTGQCRLFSQVASYSTFQRSFSDGPDAPRYFLMPGRSGRDEFCRQRSDCTDPALDCVAHICTDDRTVTCRDVLRLSGAGTLDGFHWGAVEGRTLPLSCYQDGFTLLMVATKDVGGWTNGNWRNRNEQADPNHAFSQHSYSILKEAELIRDSAAEPQFQIIVFGSYTAQSGSGGDGVHGLRMTLDRSAPLLATSPPDPSLIITSEPLGRENPISGRHPAQAVCPPLALLCSGVDINGELTVPYHRGSVYLLTANVQPRTDPGAAYGAKLHDYGTLIKADGDIRWKLFKYRVNHRPDFVKYYIRE